jgi:hypothetical protein
MGQGGISAEFDIYINRHGGGIAGGIFGFWKIIRYPMWRGCRGLSICILVVFVEVWSMIIRVSCLVYD